MKPPKCKTCGAEEWKHTCGPKLSVAEITRVVVASPEFLARKEKLDNPLPNALEKVLTKPSRKEYLKLKARERRARQKAKK